MELKYKPDFEEAKRYWRAFWDKEIIDRPYVIITSPKNGLIQSPHPPYMAGSDGNYKEALEMYESWASTIYFGAEAIPFFEISLGPDEIAASLQGAGELVKDEETKTSWLNPFVKDWNSFPEIKIDEESAAWKRIIDFYQYGATFSEGKFLLGGLDFHTNMDLLRAIRGSDNLCIDLLDCPEEIEKRMKEARKIFPFVYEAMYKAGRMKERGTIGWIPLYCEGRFAVIQCDFICMISPTLSRKFVIPALEEEASYLDHCIYHLDGPGTFPHLDNILAISKIDAIQWVPGDGQPPHIRWMDLFKKILSRNKSVIIYPNSIEEIKIFHKELGPKGVVYQIGLPSEKEAEELITWLRIHT